MPMTLSASSCEAVLRANDRGGYTVPSARLYPHQWAWDSAFAAIGWAYLDPGRAWVELRTLMDGQWEDGRVPHVYFHDLSGDYWPDAAFWGAERSSTITQPPVWASAARRVVEIAGEDPALAELVPKFAASHRFFAEQRDPNGWGAVAVVHPWESGLDNAPTWDAALAEVDVSRAPAFERRDTAVVGDPSMRPTQAQYVAYAALVKAIAEDGFGPGPFAVYDPMMTAILARAEEDLAWLAARVDQPEIEQQARVRGSRVLEGLERLWDEGSGRYRYLEGSGRAVEVDSIGSYLPVWASIPRERERRLRRGLELRFEAQWPVPSVALGALAFDPRRYWRGPSWVNVNWMLGAEYDARTLELIERSGFREYYEPLTGEGLGAEGFTWTAALALDMLARTK